MKKHVLIIFTALMAASLYSQNQNKSLYLKGNIQDKEKAVTDAAKTGDYSLALDSMDFCISSMEILGEDEDIKKLLITDLKLLQNDQIKINSQEQIAEKLNVLFKNYDDLELKTEIIKAMAYFPSQNGISLINSYVSDQMQARTEVTPVLISAIETLKKCGNGNSFNVLFISDLLDVWPEQSSLLADAYGVLAENSEKEILHILSTIPTDMKLNLLEKINRNKNISRKIKGEVAENALSMSINNTEANSENDLSSIELEYSALKTISITQWTRASSLATQYFAIAREKYENDELAEEKFADIIGFITSVATNETASVLSSYLDQLNKCTEKNQTVSKVVVLSVINSLGELGNKTAFDYLLYVTYLDYPEEVTTAARVSLTKLKW